jgi:hypothetical protein
MTVVDGPNPLGVGIQMAFLCTVVCGVAATAIALTLVRRTDEGCVVVRVAHAIYIRPRVPGVQRDRCDPVVCWCGVPVN